MARDTNKLMDMGLMESSMELKKMEMSLNMGKMGKNIWLTLILERDY